MITFESKSYENGAVTAKDDGSADINVSIISGIVGNTYNGFVNGDTTTINVPDFGTKTGPEIAAAVAAGVAAFVQSKYPPINN